MLDAAELAGNSAIIPRPRQPPELFKIVLPMTAPDAASHADSPDRLFEPAAHGDSVGHIDEPVGIHLRNR